MSKKVGQLAGTMEAVIVGRQDAQIKGQYGPPCPFGGYVGTRNKYLSSLRVIDYPGHVDRMIRIG